MELGMTFPLQRFLHQKPPLYGSESDRRFCWDLHVIKLRGRNCLLAVHCHSRYTLVRFDVPGLLWADLPALFRTGLSDSLTAAGFAPAQISAYLQAAGEARITRTHGRREVAFLTVHSMLHLLGYDHEQGGLAAVKMREKEEAVLIQLGLPRTVSYTADQI